MDFICKTFDELTTKELYEIIKARVQIFVIEQNCPYQDLDGKDYISTHVFSQDDNGNVTSCLRLFIKDKVSDTVQLGRVLTVEHGKGLGGKLLHEGVEIAKEKLNAKKIYIEAQQYAIGYYEKEGFEVCSDVFLEDGIPHVKMELNL